MDAPARPASTALDERLFAEGERFSYFQAVRLLRRQARLDGRDPHALRVRPRLGLGFPETDIDRIERVLPPVQEAASFADVTDVVAVADLGPATSTDATDAATADTGPADFVPRITANFFGLYGVSSPLPSFYTEDLLEEEREGRRGTREFLDILHYAIYPLLFDGWVKYRPQVRIVEENDAAMLDYLYAFVGLNDRAMRGRDRPGVSDLLRYAGLFSQRPHSALGLQTMLADAFAPAEVTIVSCVEGWLPIPGDQRLVLGEMRHGLGESCYLGEQARDHSSQLGIELRELPLALFDALQPGQTEHERLRFLVRFYLLDPLQVTVALQLRAGEARPARAGGMQWNRLGNNTWLAPPAHMRTREIRFPV
ncbi:type VI secretion system baseplate subunit TssG [Chitinasiproducens palmae]|uniref:Type VI secretion system protein ImpH n=1 Tax=Chitinasiproducens palmae TaxID=1770053 RepID=A0A1H2PM57_9BURK|nr:type VI secretion system baseplate subunit TssG [Chitinasiproducens palmae]SDV47139.1 type VI secretion system protein ImpH [Chitinasiproducens palmae]